MSARKAPQHPDRRPRMTAAHVPYRGDVILTWDGQSVRLGDPVKSVLGHPGRVVGLTSASSLRVEWDIGAVTLERVSELRFGEVSS